MTSCVNNDVKDTLNVVTFYMILVTIPHVIFTHVEHELYIYNDSNGKFNGNADKTRDNGQKQNQRQQHGPSLSYSETSVGILLR